MAKTKKELLGEAKQLGLEVDEKAKVVEIQLMIKNAEKDRAKTEVQDKAEKPKATAKAGKRSAKTLAETEEKLAKEERKVAEETAEVKPKKVIKPARPRIERRGRHFRKSAEQIEKGKVYGLEEAVDLAKKTSHVKFDATVELHANLGVDPRHADQNIRDNLVLPAGTGKKVRIAALTEDAEAAMTAGADLAGTDELFAAFDKNQIDFDVLVTTPNLMAKLSKYARLLGPRGLMPNPKSGTVTTDIAKAIAEAKAGRVEYRIDTTGIVHLGVGKVSFNQAQLLDNVQAVLASLKANKPSSIKGNYFQSLYLTTSMGPSIKVDLAAIGA